MLVGSSLVWTATLLASGGFYSTISIDETTVRGVSGVPTNTYTFKVDHDFRRWLPGISKFTYGTYANQGDGRFDRTCALSGDLICKVTGDFCIRGTRRRDMLARAFPARAQVRLR
jgi:hypothetical protein